MASGVTVRVSGLRETTRAFRRISKSLDSELVDGLKGAAEVVRTDAEQFALGRIRNMPASPRWAGMRIGVSSAKGSVFMVPSARRAGGSGRSNLSKLLMERSMDPAVEKNAAKVIKGVDNLLGKLAGENGF
jgi:hypothetical protein